ncbi:MAG: hypothetical protein JSV04_01960 [Candidatus Heimdallarchaeota archaeon]|nr:MAG: hypothetical protein JSV04_01960 [Candidatus Heimdallarchaeota archaeon]
MIIGLIGARGTVPTSEVATVSFLVDNRYLFECPSEIIQAFHRYQQLWIKQQNQKMNPKLEALGKPTLGKMSHIILSHLHFDHWGGLAHIIHRILLLEKEKRIKNPLNVIIPRMSTFPLQQRMHQTFNETKLDSPLPDDEFFYRLLTIEVGESVRTILRIIVIEDGETILLDPGYFLSARKNTHFTSGSLSYKLEFRIAKLNVEKAKKMGIPFNRTLKRIEKGTHEKFSRSDYFFDEKTVLCYSGDTPVDPDLFQFFHDCQILIHESTYLSQDEEYHLDSHSDILSLIKEADRLSSLMALIPIHFSIRYTEEEISNCLTALPIKTYTLIDPINDFIIHIEPQKPANVIERPK